MIQPFCRRETVADDIWALAESAVRTTMEAKNRILSMDSPAIGLRRCAQLLLRRVESLLLRVTGFNFNRFRSCGL